MSGHPFVYLWVFSLSVDEGKRKIALMERMLFGCEIYNGKPILQNGWCFPFLLLCRNRPRFLSLGTDSRRRFVPSVFNPVGPFSQEGILHNPRQRFETVWRLSEQEKTTKRTTHQPKRRSLTAGKMATKSLKTRYVSSTVALKWKLAIERLWIAILEGFLKSLRCIFVRQMWICTFSPRGLSNVR